MPKDLNAPVWPEMRTLHKGEDPRTRFLDMENAKRVTVLDYPGLPDRPNRHVMTASKRVFDGGCQQLLSRLTFARTCHSTEPVDLLDGDSWDMLQSAAGGKLLWQVAETLNYTLRLEGLSRICSHQLVRMRVGVTFSETCTGDHDWRHADFLVPRHWKFYEDDVSGSLEDRIRHGLRAKALYAAAVDQGETPNTARYMIPPNLKVFVHMHTNLGSLAQWYAKRVCTMTQSWEMVVLAERVRQAVVAVTPWAAAAFQNPCKAGRCWYMRAKEDPLAMSNYYPPDKVHDTFNWHPDSFLYQRPSYAMMSDATPIPTRWYVGNLAWIPGYSVSAPDIPEAWLHSPARHQRWVADELGVVQ